MVRNGIVFLSIWAITASITAQAAEVASSASSNDRTTPLPPTKPKVSSSTPKILTADKSERSKTPEDNEVQLNSETLRRLYADYDLVIAVDKNPDKQSLRVFSAKNGSDVKQPIITTKISTGTESISCVPVRDKNGRRVATRRMFTSTPTGFFPVDYLDIDHHSSSLDDAHMPYTIHLKGAGGVAIHQAPWHTEEHLGRPASHGCIRMAKTDVQRLFSMVLKTGGPLHLGAANFNGKCALSAPASFDPERVANCRRAARVRTLTYQKFLKGIVNNPSESFSRETPRVKNIGRTSGITSDETFDGYKTVVVIQDSTPKGLRKSKNWSNASCSGSPKTTLADRSTEASSVPEEQPSIAKKIFNFLFSGQQSQPAPVQKPQQSARSTFNLPFLGGG